MTFKAPWSKSLKWISILATTLMLGVSGFILSGALGVAGMISGILPILIVLVALLFTIRGYEVGPDGLRVQRLLWTTDISLDNLQRAWADPKATHRSLRLFGNGGLFSFSGLFRNKKLGNYRAFVTNPATAVVLDFGHRKMVVTPDRPDALLRYLRELRPELESGPLS